MLGLPCRVQYFELIVDPQTNVVRRDICHRIFKVVLQTDVGVAVRRVVVHVPRLAKIGRMIDTAFEEELFVVWRMKIEAILVVHRLIRDRCDGERAVSLRADVLEDHVPDAGRVGFCTNLFSVNFPNEVYMGRGKSDENLVSVGGTPRAGQDLWDRRLLEVLDADRVVLVVDENVASLVVLVLTTFRVRVLIEHGGQHRTDGSDRVGVFVEEHHSDVGATVRRNPQSSQGGVEGVDQTGQRIRVCHVELCP